ncbi:MAG: DMT family transporter [Chloroflexota bacterium]
MPIQALPYILTLGLLFGSTLVASRFSVGQFDTVNYIAIRLSLAALLHALVFLFAIKGRRWPRGRELWRRSAVLGIFGTAIPMNAITASLNFQSSGVTAFLITLGPVFTILIAHFYLDDERLNRRNILGIALALSGAILMVALGETGLPEVSEANPLGYLLVLIAMVSASFGTVYARKYMHAMDAFDVGSIRMWVAAAVVLPASLLLVGFDLSGVDPKGYTALGWATFAGTFTGMLLSFYIIKRFGATASAMTAYVIPIFSSVGGVLLLNETITSGMLAGIVLMLSGVMVINQRTKNEKKPAGVQV